MKDHDRIQELLRIKEQAPVSLDAEETALIIVDVQRWFTRPEYPRAEILERLVGGSTTAYFERVESTVLRNIQRLLQAFRARSLPVIYLAVGCCLPDGRDLPEWICDFDQLGLKLLGKRVTPPVNDPSWQIDDRVAPLPGEMVLNKTSSGAMASTKLDQTLHNSGINSLVVCGLTTAVCVSQTAREAADRGFRVMIAEDACTEMSQEMHETALFAFRFVFGRVQSTEQIVKLLGAATTAA